MKKHLNKGSKKCYNEYVIKKEKEKRKARQKCCEGERNG